MRVELINTGSELLLGQTLNTHAQWLGQQLFPLGLRLQRQVAVPDGDIIREVLQESFPRCDLLLVTGGLGPTSDDITREGVSALLGRPLKRDPAVVEAIRTHLARRERELTEATLRQALVPEGAQVLPNPFGTAPGLYFTAGPGLPHLFLLPGPPRELHPMWRDHVEPRLRALRLGAAPPLMREFCLHGAGEVHVSRTVERPLLEAGVTDLGYCARPGEVVVRCIGPEAVLAAAAEIMRAAFPQELFSETGESLPEAVSRLLRVRRESLAVAESCTGGLLCSRLTDLAGSSDLFGWGLVTYANEAKVRLLGVPPSLLEERGAVSSEVATAMAEGALRESSADHALAVTGIAGPGGGTSQKPVGTAWLALASRTARTVTRRVFRPAERVVFKTLVSDAALDLLRLRLSGRLPEDSDGHRMEPAIDHQLGPGDEAAGAH